MAITISEYRGEFERVNNISDATESITRVYSVSGAETSNQAYSAVMSSTPAQDSGLDRATITLRRTPESVDDNSGGLLTHYEATVVWRTPEDGGEQQDQGSIYTTSRVQETVRITQSLATVAAFGLPIPPEEFKNLLGVTYDGESLRVDGLDIISSIAQIQWTRTRPRSGVGSISDAQIRQMQSIRAVVNSDPFAGYEPGELLLFSPDASVGQSTVRITYTMSARRNQDFELVGDILVEGRQGWQALEVLYQNVMNFALGQSVSVPVYATIRTVYPTMSFSELGIPDPRFP